MSLKVISASDLEGVVTLSESSESRTTNILSKYVDTVKHVWLSDNELISLRDYLNVRFPAEDIGQPVDENQLSLLFTLYSLLFDLVKNPIANFVPAKAEEPAVVYVRTCMNCRYEALPGSRLQCIDCCKTILRPNFTSKN